jgi:NAD(P)-dependent dehydrogenase (short-subunit alcohol dehydrogenase family)
VVQEIEAAGGRAIANDDDVSDFDSAGRLVRAAIEHFGRLDVVVNNAGILRDRMIVNMTIDEWDAVIRVHLRSTFSITHHAASHWRELAKSGETVDARVINTSSSSGIYGNVGQTNYGAAKAGIAALTVIAAMELGRYGVTVNAIAPEALTRMTEDLGGFHDPESQEWDPLEPENVAPVVVWLGSADSRPITGRVFNVRGGYVSVAEGWVAGPGEDRGSRWEPGEVGEVIPRLVAEARPNSDTAGRPMQDPVGT